MANDSTPFFIISWTLCGARDAGIVPEALRSIASIADGRLLVWTSNEPCEMPPDLGHDSGVYKVPFRWCDDFAAARNASLGYAAEKMWGAQWSVMCDADERVICPDPAAFRAWLEALPADVQVVLVHHHDGSHTRERFFRCSSPYRFQGRTHEAFVIPCNFQAIAPKELIQWSELPKSEAQLTAKFERDIAMLKADIAERPDFGPPYYYLGYTLQIMGRYQEAIDAYREHLKLDSLENGAWSAYRAAECYLKLNQPNRALDAVQVGLVRDAGIAELYWIAGVASLHEGRTEQARCWAASAKAHAMGSDSERRRVGFRVPEGLTTGPDSILAAVKGASGAAPIDRVRAIVFSKDRPMQLDACLRSLRMHCKDVGSLAVHVLYKATSPEMARAYGEIASEQPWARLHEERAFEAQTRGLLAGCEYVLFVVDDTVFVRGFEVVDLIESLDDHTEAIGVSLRLGANCKRCYPEDREQEKPARGFCDCGSFVHEWAGADGDWGYPLEVSSSLYRSSLILGALYQRSPENPNRLEAMLTLRAHDFIPELPYLLTPHTSLAFSVPANRVQDTFANRAGSDPSLSSPALFARWQAGERIDVAALAGYVPSACHEDVAFTFERRERPRVEVISRPIHITVASAARNAEKWAAKCVGSVRKQTFQAWDHYYIDDASGDNTWAEVFGAMNEDNTILARNPERRGVLANMLSVWRSLPPDDVVVWLDGDDWLIDDNALQIVADAHARGAWVTYGQFQWASTGAVGFAAPCGPDPRSEPWRATHLRTFRAGLVQRIKDEDLRWDKHPDAPPSDYFDQAAEDQSIMLPVLEMAGQDRARFISTPLMVYNDANMRTLTDAQRAREQEGVRVIRARARYSRIGAL